jgi:serine/threonine protein kinase
MLGRLKGMFGGSKDPKPTKPRRSRVNLQRRFTIQSETAQGTMSRVSRATDSETGRTVCLKIQIREKHVAAAARTGQEVRPEEGEIASQIIHPHVVRTFDYGESTRGEHFVVMEYIEGVSLKFLRETGGLDLPAKIEVLAQAADGLAAVHAKGFIHHDIGPKNFLVDREHQVKLIDFGLAVPNTPRFQRPGNRTGTLQYMAPELIRRSTIDERIDIFSFGAMAYEFLIGKMAYDAENAMGMMLQRLNQEIFDPAVAARLLPPKLAEILRKTLERRKEDRWPKMATLPDALRDAIA